MPVRVRVPPSAPYTIKIKSIQYYKKTEQTDGLGRIRSGLFVFLDSNDYGTHKASRNVLFYFGEFVENIL
jgi:hypothetical protein